MTTVRNETPEPNDSSEALHALYRAAADEAPSPQLDLAILSAARADLDRAKALPTSHSRSGWRRWMMPVSAVAVALFGLSLAWHVMDEQEMAQRRMLSTMPDELKEAAAPAPAPAGTDSAAATQPTVDQETVRDVEVKAKGKPASADSLKAMPPLAKPAASPSPELKRENVRPLAESAQDIQEKENAASGQRSEAAPMPAAASAPEPAAALAPQEIRAKAMPQGGVAPEASARRAAPLGQARKLDSAQPAEAAPATDGAIAVDAARLEPTTPDAWLQQIRALRAAGRHDEAAQSLARWHARYPDLAVPTDLADLMPATAR